MKKKIGRPKLPNGKIRQVHPLRLSKEELISYKKAAERDKKPLSEWMRNVLTKASF